MAVSIAIVGGGGHGKVIRDMIEGRDDFTIKAILDDKQSVFRIEDGVYVGPVAAAASVRALVPNVRFVIAVGDNRTRKRLAARLAGLGETRYAPPLVHPSASVSPRCKLGAGAVVMANAVVNADAAVGSHAIVNTGAIVEHDCVVEPYAHVAPSAALTGGVIVEEGAFVGAGATVIPGRRVGAWATVGAGAVVIRDVPPRATAVGTPAKIVKFKEDGEDGLDQGEAALANLPV